MPSTAATAFTSTTEREVRRLKALQKEGRHEAALAGAEALLADFPENRDLLLLTASNQRRLMRIDDALLTLERLRTLQPRFSRQWEERGLCHVARMNAPAAIEALLLAVNINPALPMSWRMLEGLYRLTGDGDNAATAAAHVAALKALPPEVVAATSLFSDEEIAAAEQRVRAFLLRRPDHPEAMRPPRQDRAWPSMSLDDAELVLEAAVECGPGLSGGPLRLRSMPFVTAQISGSGRASREAAEG